MGGSSCILDPHISIHALFAEGDRSNFLQKRGKTISIHALFAEGDRLGARPARRRRISIHALFAEGDHIQHRGAEVVVLFLSTPSSQRATANYSSYPVKELHFYPRPLRRGRHIEVSHKVCRHHISIHALFAEGDKVQRAFKIPWEISIHALFAEGDRLLSVRSQRQPIFLSTPSSQRATANMPNSIRHI